MAIKYLDIVKKTNYYLFNCITKVIRYIIMAYEIQWIVV